MVKIGIVGSSPQNGHPYSFSAILNGYSKDSSHWNQWEGIFNYLNENFPENTPNSEAQVTHVWTQDKLESENIARASLIPKVSDSLRDFHGEVDAVIIARDDYKTHLELSKEFLEKGIPVFIDKPLTLSLEELSYFKPFINDGLLMSCSGLYYAKELKVLDKTFVTQTQAVSANVLNSWEKYGVHMLDAILGVIDYRVESISAMENKTFMSLIRCANGPDININSLGSVPKTFNLRFWSKEKTQEIEISNNYAAFKSTLEHFILMVQQKKPILNPEHTLQTVKTLIAGNMSVKEKREVFINELSL